MSERAPIQAQDPYDQLLAPAQSRPREHRFLRGLGKFTAGFVGINVLAGAGSYAAWEEPLALQEALLFQAGEAYNDLFDACDPIDDATIQKFDDKLKADTDATSKLSDEKRAELSATVLPTLAKNLNLTFPDRKETDTLIKDIKASADFPQMAVGLANNFTKKQYGIRVTNEGVPTAQTAEDTATVVSQLVAIPNELVRKVAENDLDEITVNTQGLTMHNGSSPAGGTYTPALDRIQVAPKAGLAIDHEFGHALAVTASRELCTFASPASVPNFDAANPEGFVYGEDDTAWKGVTVSEYGAKGDYDPSEDVAETIEALKGKVDGQGKNMYGISETINKKMAAVLAMEDLIVPGMGTYDSRRNALASHK